VLWRLVLVGAALAGLVLPIPATAVERYYSSLVFPWLQARLTSASNLSSVAWFDLFVVVAGTGLLVRCVADLMSRRVPVALVRIVLRLATVGAIVYLAFLATWGLNYRREPLRQKVPYTQERVTPDAALTLARETLGQVNATHARAHAEGWPSPDGIDPRLAASFAETTKALGFPDGIVPGRPKHSLLDLYFRRAGVAGMTDPFFLETLIASDALPFERPQIVAHEWAHLAGVTDEGEANFVGWLSAARAGTAHRYSAWLFLYTEIVGMLPNDAARELNANLAAGPRDDLRAMRERHEREVSPRLSMAGWQVYDKYLKANQVQAGTASYAEVVQLILGTGLR
jgi:hypothetical protein